MKYQKLLLILKKRFLKEEFPSLSLRQEFKITPQYINFKQKILRPRSMEFKPQPVEPQQVEPQPVEPQPVEPQPVKKIQKIQQVEPQQVEPQVEPQPVEPQPVKKIQKIQQVEPQVEPQVKKIQKIQQVDPLEKKQTGRFLVSVVDDRKVTYIQSQKSTLEALYSGWLIILVYYIIERIIVWFYRLLFRKKSKNDKNKEVILNIKKSEEGEN